MNVTDVSTGMPMAAIDVRSWPNSEVACVCRTHKQLVEQVICAKQVLDHAHLDVLNKKLPSGWLGAPKVNYSQTNM